MEVPKENHRHFLSRTFGQKSKQKCGHQNYGLIGRMLGQNILGHNRPMGGKVVKHGCTQFARVPGPSETGFFAFYIGQYMSWQPKKKEKSKIFNFCFGE